ncbi:arylalkylamine N-acetyltransferase 1-like isoform X2 [Cylas formicarius]|nr:arylalkylamine N-acetyltransferase 1-like isoform X2 [Cylas formicarius]
MDMASPPTPTTPVSPDDYEIQIATVEDKDDILNFLQTFFFKDEPLNKYLGLISEERPRCYDLEDFALKDIDKEVTLKAVHNGRIIGVCLNGILEKGYIDEEEDEVKDEKFRKIAKLLGRVAVESDVFSKFPDAKRAITTKIISVNGTYRGQGIARELMNKTRELAKNLGCGFMTVDCTSHFTALALKKLGFELVYTLKYADYVDNGEVVFEPEPPHDAVTVYVQRITV